MACEKINVFENDFDELIRDFTIDKIEEYISKVFKENPMARTTETIFEIKRLNYKKLHDFTEEFVIMQLEKENLDKLIEIENYITNCVEFNKIIDEFALRIFASML